MKRIPFQHISLIGLLLMGASAITAAVLPSKENMKKGALPDNGRAVESSYGGGITVIRTVQGSRSHTMTGSPFDDGDHLSATSVNDSGTDTYDCPCYTGFGTTDITLEVDCDFSKKI